MTADRAPGARHRVAKALRLHGPLVVGLPICLYAGWFELHRALHHHLVAWVYAVEWPMFAVIGVAMWWRVWHSPEDSTLRRVRRQLAGADRPSDGGGPARAVDRVPDDPGLQAWQEYLARLHEADPPGGPPARVRQAGPGGRVRQGGPPDG